MHTPNYATDTLSPALHLANGMPVALVTGAAKRLGKAIALHLASCGWRVAIHYRHSEQDALATKAALPTGQTAIFQADLSQAGGAVGLVQQIVTAFGRLDAVVNSASQFEHDAAASFSRELALSHFSTNCVAPIELAQALYQHRKSSKQTSSGVVVNLLDQKLWNLNPDFVSYTLSKAALQAATTMLAQAFAPELRVCAVAPGLSLPSYLQDDAGFEKAHKVSPLGRSSTPEDIAKTVAFILDNQSMTGAQVLVDGGQHLMHLPRDISFIA